jgi:hypothetical protein
MKDKNILSLSLLLLFVLMVNISYTSVNISNDEEWILVGKNQDYESIQAVLDENKDQLIRIKLVDSVHKEEKIEINGQVYIEGYSKEKTIIQGSGENDTSGGRIFKVLTEGNLTLKNLIIEKGFVNEHPRAGAGIYNMGTSKTINCIIQKNIGTYGVGIYNEGHLEVDSSIVQYNRSVKRPREEDAIGLGCAGSGGGIKIQRGTFMINNTLIKNNTAVRTGGGIKVSCPGKGIIKDSIITGNTAEDFGGGLSINGETSISNSIILNNAAHKGGGIHLVGTLDLKSNIIISNESQDLELMLTNQNFTPELRKNNKNIILNSIPSKYNMKNKLTY